MFLNNMLKLSDNKYHNQGILQVGSQNDQNTFITSILNVWQLLNRRYLLLYHHHFSLASHP